MFHMVATYLFYLGTKQVTVPACIYSILSTVECGLWTTDLDNVRKRAHNLLFMNCSFGP